MWPRIILILLGGAIAASGLIIAKAANAKDLLAKITPYQGFIGVALLGFGVFDLLTHISEFTAIFKFQLPLWSITLLGWFVGSIVLGFILGIPQIAAWIPGESNAEQKVVNIQKKLMPFQAIFGIIGLVTGVLLLLFQLGILKFA
ncbi:MAG: hypothetical protein K8W52_09385 [Deltaproteobacteria bacterium]|nr:hypothetical protein [Deltaproteobacteria bacterium]